MKEKALDQRVFINRVPVLDSRLKTCAYEIELFDHVTSPAPVAAERICGGNRLSAALDLIDPHQLLGDRNAIVRIDPADHETLFSEKWANRLILEIPASSFTDSDPKLMNRLRDCTGQWCIGESSSPEYVTVVPPADCLMKIDISRTSEAELTQRVKVLRDNRVTAIATSVESREQFQMCTRAGVNLVMGGFYAEPPPTRQKSITPNQALLLELSAKTTAQDSDIRAIEAIFKKNPDLAFGLMNLVQSAFYRGSEHVASIRQAIALLGYENLHKWVALMLFSIKRSDLGGNPLFEKALIRARTMELAAMKLRHKGLGSSAYISGIFSLVPALFDVSLEEILTKANFVDEIKQALIEGTGILGDLLAAVKELEKGRYETLSLPQGLGLQQIDLFGSYTEAVMEHAVDTNQMEAEVKSVALSPAHRPGDGRVRYTRAEGSPSWQENPSWLWRLLVVFGLKNRRNSTV